ncbi:MAG: hypothetical protein AB1609_11575 [Bacillota bacterium]
MPSGTNKVQNGRRDEIDPGLSKQRALELVARALDEVEYGEIIVKMQGGKPVWVDKYDRQRVG